MEGLDKSSWIILNINLIVSLDGTEYGLIEVIQEQNIERIYKYSLTQITQVTTINRSTPLKRQLSK